MLFKKKNCDSCQGDYDEMLDFCPYCHNKNGDKEEFKKKFPLLFFPFPIEIALFVIGVFGFSIFNILFTLIFSNVYKANQLQGTMLITLCSYLVFFLFIIALSARYWRSLLDNLKGWRPYLVGFVGSFVVICGSIAITIIMSVITGNQSEGGNQSAIVQLTKTYPAFAVMIFGIVGPICEEFSYRVGLFSLLRRVARWLAYLGSAIIFGLIHFDWTGDLIVELINLPSYIWAGIAFAIIYEIGGIGASTMSHMVNNLFSIIMIFI